jgi:hypothetical protein
VTRRT